LQGSVGQSPSTTIFKPSGVQYVNFAPVQQYTGARVPPVQGQGVLAIDRDVGFADWQSSVT